MKFFQLIVILASAAGVLAGSDAKTAARLDQLLSKYEAFGQLNGAVLVARGGEVLLEKGYGEADMAWGIPNTSDTRFRIGSITKVFTAMLIMQLVDEGKLSLDTKLIEALPTYRSDVGARVTIRHLLTHTSGIPDYFRVAGGHQNFSRDIGADPINKAEFVRKYCSGNLEFEPGSRWRYCNSGYFLLGMIIERLREKRYAEALKDKVLDPAGMKDTGDEEGLPRAVIPRLATGYTRGLSGRLEREEPWNMSSAFAAGSMYSTIGDLYRFDQALHSGKLVSERARREMFSPGIGNWGCGWEIRTAPIGPGAAERSVLTHEGFLFAWHTRLYRVAEDNILVVIFSNAGDSPLEKMFRGTVDILNGRTPVTPLPSAADSLAREIATGGIDAAISGYRARKQKEPDQWDFAERGLNTLGYRLLRSQRAIEAVAVFSLMVEVYPASGNAWDSLGEGLSVLGKKDESIRAYQKSLELDPKNENARQQLEKLMPAAPSAATPDGDFLPYDPGFQPTPVRIVPAKDLDRINAPFVVARLENGKLALMARDAKGELVPFFVKGIETGFWDTRGRDQKTDWDEVFANYRKFGANVSLFMLHWKDIEPEEGRFTFDFTDQIVSIARKHGVKIWWVFFMHDNGQLRRGRDFWVFNYDNRGSANYAVQWVKDEKGNILDSFDKIRATQAELLPCYAHPKIFAFQNRVIRQLARRYRDSDAVIGMQIGNEEGFIPNVPPNREVDVNPYTLKFYEDWKIKTGKSDWNAFKSNAVAWWWRSFTTSFHAEDPYKLTSFNLWGAFGEQGRAEVIRSQGADHTVYALGNLDVIGSMFYRDEARAVWPNMDAFYLDYLYNLPILLPSEIGIGGQGPHTEIVGGSKVIFQEYTINALERGANGYSAYCYGQMMDDSGKPDPFADAYRRLAVMVTSVEDVLHPGVPGPGAVAFSTGAEGAKISHLSRPDGATVGILRFPEAAFDNQAPDPSRVSFVADQNTKKLDVKVEIAARKVGTYVVEVFRDGELALSKSVALKAGEKIELDLAGVRATEAVFLKAVPRR